MSTDDRVMLGVLGALALARRVEDVLPLEAPVEQPTLDDPLLLALGLRRLARSLLARAAALPPSEALPEVAAGWLGDWTR